jgi:hypothetical protein
MFQSAWHGEYRAASRPSPRPPSGPVACASCGPSRPHRGLAQPRPGLERKSFQTSLLCADWPSQTRPESGSQWEARTAQYRRGWRARKACRPAPRWNRRRPGWVSGARLRAGLRHARSIHPTCPPHLPSSAFHLPSVSSAARPGQLRSSSAGCFSILERPQDPCPRRPKAPEFLVCPFTPQFPGPQLLPHGYQPISNLPLDAYRSRPLDVSNFPRQHFGSDKLYPTKGESAYPTPWMLAQLTSTSLRSWATRSHLDSGATSYFLNHLDFLPGCASFCALAGSSLNFSSWVEVCNWLCHLFLCIVC